MSPRRLHLGDAVTVEQARAALSHGVSRGAVLLGVSYKVARRWADELQVAPKKWGRRPARLVMPPDCDPWAASREAVAAEYGVSSATVGRWRKAARRAA